MPLPAAKKINNFQATLVETIKLLEREVSLLKSPEAGICHLCP